MPPVIAAVGAIAATTFLGVSIGSIVVSAAASFGAGMLARALAPKPTPEPGSPALPPQAAPVNASRSIAVRQPVPPRRFVYGNVRVGGVIFFQDNDNPNLYIGTALCDGEIEGVTGVYVGDKQINIDGSGDAVSGTDYFGNFSVELTVGEDSQTANTDLTTTFPDDVDSNFRQRGVARAVAVLDWGADASEHGVLWGGSVSLAYVLQGMLVYDRRDVTHDVDDASTWAYSTNPVLCTMHALTNNWISPLASADVDWSTVGAAADVCDATVDYNGDTLALFELAGIFQASVNVSSQIQEMLESFGGALLFHNGKYEVHADAERSPGLTITDDDILDVGEYQHAAPFAQTPNAIKAVYYDSVAGGERQTTEVYDDTAAQDKDGVTREISVDIGFTARTHSAQILAYRELKKARDGRELTVEVTDIGLFMRPFEVITMQSTTAPWLDGDFEIEQVDLTQRGAVLKLKGYAAAAYTDPTTYLV